MKKLKTTHAITRIALVAGLYVAVSYVFAFAASGEVQFRIAEVLNLLAVFNPIYIVAVTLGCVITNILTSPLGIVDVIVGSSATLAATGLIWVFRKNMWIASLFPLINGPIVAYELAVLLNLDFWSSFISITLAEFVVVTVIGVPLFKRLMKNKRFMEIV